MDVYRASIIDMYLKTILLSLLVAFSVSTPALAQDDAATSIPQDRIVARVNNDIVTSGDIWQRYYTIQRSSGLPDNAEIRADVFPQILSSLIDEQLQLQEAARQGIVVDDEIMDKALLDMAQNNKLSNVQEFETILNKQNVSIDNIKQQIKPQIAWSGAVQKNLRPDIKVTTDELATLRDDLNKTKGVTEHQIAEITLDASDETKRENALNLAEKLSIEMSKGAPFREVASKFSHSASKTQGGLLGWIVKSEMPTELHDTLDNLPKGRLSPPVVADGKVWLLLKLDERVGQGAPEDDILKERILTRKLEKSAATYLQDLRDQALIVFP